MEVPDHPRVLVVDDDARTARLLARLLEQDGFVVDVETDGAAAIARLTRAPVPQLLVTDLRMPLADGLVVARCARAQSPAIPVFFVTSYPEVLARLNDQLAPMAHVFSKPLAYPELTAAMRGSLIATIKEKTS
ncbi:MAG: response regulator [Polyangiales bacterium]